MSLLKKQGSIYNSTKHEIEQTIVTFDTHAAGNDLASQVSEQLHLSSNAFRNWRASRTSSTGRKATTNIQSFLTTFADFLESFSGICEIVKGADQQYGGLAYGTLSVLLGVAVHKSQREEVIEDTLEELHFAFPRLQVLTDLQPSNKLQELIADVFALVITYLKEATEYYLYRRQRLKDTFVPSKIKGKTLTRIRKQLAEIRKESDILMLQDIRKMRHTIEDMNRTLRSTQASVLAQGSSADGTLLSNLRSLLGVRADSAHMSFTDYSKLLTTAFNVRRAAIHVPYETTHSLLMENSSFAQWNRSEQSSILFVGGVNWHKQSCRDLNWLSQGSLIVIDHHKTQGHKVIWFLCQTDWTVSSRKRCTLQEILAHLIYELVCLHQDRLRIRHDYIQATVGSDPWKNGSPEEILNLFSELFLVLLLEFGAGAALTIVIDRLDRCRWNDEEGQEGWSMRFVLEMFLDMMEKAVSRLKVLVVVDTLAAQMFYDYQVRNMRLLRDIAWPQKLH